MKWIVLIPLFLLTILTAFGSAQPVRCYPDPQRPLDQISVIKVQRSSFSFLKGSESYGIYAINNKKIESDSQNAPEEVHVLPGEYEITFEAAGGNQYLMINLRPKIKLSAEAGKTYLFRCQRNGRKPVIHKFWVESLPELKIAGGPVYHQPDTGMIATRPSSWPIDETSTTQTLPSPDKKTGTGEDIVEQLKAKAVTGDSTSQAILGEIFYRRGVAGSTNDHTEAMKWLSMAVSNKNPLAYYYFGRFFDEGIGVKKDPEKARQFFNAEFPSLLKGAEDADPRWQFALSMSYQKGYGTQTNKVEAIKWLKKSAEKEYALAQVSLGLCYFAGKDVEKEDEQAKQWLSRALESARKMNDKGVENLASEYLGRLK